MGETAWLTVRQMTLEDIPAVHRIEIKSFKVPWSFNYFLRCLQKGEMFGLVVTDAEEIAAYALLNFSDKVANVTKFAVAPNFRRRTLGKKFFEFIMNLARQKAQKKIKLHVFTNNFIAIHLYKSCGLKIVERLKNFYPEENADGFTMEGRL